MQHKALNSLIYAAGKQVKYCMLWSILPQVSTIAHIKLVCVSLFCRLQYIQILSCFQGSYKNVALFSEVKLSKALCKAL